MTPLPLDSAAAAAAGVSPADVLDILVAAALAIGGLVGLFRGFSGELARIAALVASALAGWSAAGPWRRMCGQWLDGSPVGTGVMTLVGVLAVSIVAGSLVRRIVDKGLRVLIPQPANGVLGLAAGLASLFLLVSALCYLLHLVPIDFVQNSLLAPSRTWRAVSAVFGWQPTP